MDVITAGILLIGGGIIFSVLIIAAGVFLGNLFSEKTQNSENQNMKNNMESNKTLNERVEEYIMNNKEYLAEAICELTNSGIPFDTGTLAKLELSGFDSKRFIAKCCVDNIYRKHIENVFKGISFLNGYEYYLAKNVAKNYEEILENHMNKHLEFLKKDLEFSKKFIKFLILIRFLFDKKYLMYAEGLIKLWEEKGRNLKNYGDLIKGFETYYDIREDDLNNLLNDFEEFIKERNIKIPSIKDLHPFVQQAAEMWGITDENLFEKEEKSEKEISEEKQKE